MKDSLTQMKESRIRFPPFNKSSVGAVRVETLTLHQALVSRPHSLSFYSRPHTITQKRFFPFLYTLNFCADLDQFILGLSWFFMIANFIHFHRPCGQPFSEEKTSGKTDRRTTTRNRYFSKLLSQWQCVCVRLWSRVHEGKLLSEAQNPTVSF